MPVTAIVCLIPWPPAFVPTTTTSFAMTVANRLLHSGELGRRRAIAGVPELQAGRAPRDHEGHHPEAVVPRTSGTTSIEGNLARAAMR